MRGGLLEEDALQDRPADLKQLREGDREGQTEGTGGPALEEEALPGESWKQEAGWSVSAF